MKTRQNQIRYKPKTAEVKQWSAIEQHYVDLNNHGWMHDSLLLLVRHIISSGLSNRLFAFTSLDKLVVGIYEPMEFDREGLHMEFDRTLQKWLFKYYPKPNEPDEFERQYAAEKGIEKFDNFIKMMKW